MFKVIKKFLDIDRKDKIVFFLTGSMIGNIVMAIIKFMMSVTIPSFWFFVNAGFSLVLGTSKILTIKSYKKIKTIKEIKITNFANALASMKDTISSAKNAMYSSPSSSSGGSSGSSW